MTGRQMLGYQRNPIYIYMNLWRIFPPGAQRLSSIYIAFIIHLPWVYARQTKREL